MFQGRSDWLVTDHYQLIFSDRLVVSVMADQTARNVLLALFLNIFGFFLGGGGV